MSAIQDQLGGNHCWGCGIDNPDGLQLRSSWLGGGRATLDWQPWPRFMAGPTHVLNGGVISTVFDCHGVCTAIADLADGEGVDLSADAGLWAVTAALEVRYLAPTPIDAAVHVDAEVTERGTRKRIVEATMRSGDTPTATARIVAVRVEGWRRA